MEKIHEGRAKRIIHLYLEKMKTQNEFFHKMRMTRFFILKMQRGLKFSYRRRTHKKKVLLYYWEQIVERCKRLSNHGYIEELKWFKGN